MRRFMHGVWFVVAALLLAGCASTSEPASDPAPDVPGDAPLTAEEAFGDFTTIDYCGLVDVSVLGEVMTVEGDARKSFDHCYVEGTVQGVPIQVQVGHIGDPATSPTSVERDPRVERDLNNELPRGLTVERVRNDHDRCEFYLSFADYRLRLITDVRGPGKISQEESCVVTEKALDSVVATVTGQGVVRHFTFADNSLGSLDACDVLTSTQVASALRVPAVEMFDSPSGHDCMWQVGKERVMERDPYAVMATMRVDHAPDWDHSEMIAGRQTYVLDGGSAYCSFETVHVPFAEARNGESEIVNLHVQNWGSPDSRHACEVGRELAESAKLPPL